MVNTPAKEAVEQFYGKPLQDLIPELWLRYRSLDTVAQHMGIARATLIRWMRQYGISETTLRYKALEAAEKADATEES